MLYKRIFSQNFILGVKCFNVHDKAKCGNCPDGFEGNGVKCTAADDPCASFPCFEGVQCINVRMGNSTGYVCGLCPDGMTGKSKNLIIPCRFLSKTLLL